MGTNHAWMENSPLSQIFQRNPTSQDFQIIEYIMGSL